MLIRLLVVVLTLVGPMPFRVCTCAAGLPTQTAAERPAPVTPAATKPCGCQHESVRAVSVDADAPAHTDSHSDSSDPTGSTSHPDRHERDCPATNPTPVVRDAVTPPAVDAPTDYVGSTPPVWAQPSQLLTTSLVCRPAPPRASKLPLYITLLSIQN